MDSKQQKRDREILKAFSNDQHKSIAELLSLDKFIDLTQIKNTKLFTVLHFSCFNNNLQLSQMIIRYIIEAKSPLKEFINCQNKEGFTALHLASFKGNLELVQLLLDNGAEHLTLSKQGLSVLHMAVQGDHVRMSHFWVQKGVSVNIEDANGHTPLIWAAFLGSQQMVNFLIPWGAYLDWQTKDKKQTALHTATIQGHQRIVRKLLIKGINRKIRDKNDKLALDYAKENRFRNIQQMIENKMGILETCGIRQPYSKVESQYKSFSIFILFFSITTLATVLFTFPFVDGVTILIYAILNSVTLLSFIAVSRSDPGFAKFNNDLGNLLQCHQVESICPECSDLKPSRSRHCEICGRCVQKYDHHCPWLNNCIGKNNQKLFLVFVFSFIVSLTYQIVIQIQTLHEEDTHFDVFEYEMMLLLKEITFYIIVIFSILALVPITVLFVQQIMNAIKNQTTYERYLQRKGLTKYRKSSSESQSKVILPRDQSSSTSTADSYTICGSKRKKYDPLLETEFT